MKKKKGRSGVVGKVHKDSTAKSKPQPRVITAPEVVQVPRGTELVMEQMGISATGPGTLYFAQDPGKKPKPGTYETRVIAKSTDPLWVSATVDIRIEITADERTLTGALAGAWKVGDTLGLPPAGLVLSDGPQNFRVVAPPGGLFEAAGPTPVIIEAGASGNFSAARWEGSVVVGKGTPKIAWTHPTPAVKGVVVGGPALFARITPTTLAFVYAPPKNTQPDYGSITLTASRAGDNNYEAVSQLLAITIVGESGDYDNPLDLATIPQKRASPDVGTMTKEQVAKAFAKKTPEQVCNELNQTRYITATMRPGRSGKVTMVDVVDDRYLNYQQRQVQRVTAIEFHSGGGIHSDTPYVRIGTTQGKIKVVQPDYDPQGEKPIETIYITG